MTTTQLFNPPVVVPNQLTHAKCVELEYEYFELWLAGTITRAEKDDLTAHLWRLLNR